MAIIREERIGNQRLILGDCLQVMPTLGRFDACVTDPPYGIGEHGGSCRTRSRRGVPDRPAKSWDGERQIERVCAAIAISDASIVWGGNYYADVLPPKPSWLYWRKLIGGDFADGELAWSSLGHSLREFTKSTRSVRPERAHPTQKPVALMEWCLGFLPDAKSILDPFAGSGTTAVACERMGRHCTAIELDPDYFEIMCRRVDEQVRQPRLELPEPPRVAVQEDLF